MNQHGARPAELTPDAAFQVGQLQDGQFRDAQPGAETSVVRGGPEWRQLSFRASAVVDIRHGQGVTTVEADTLGRFSAEDIPSGQISLRCRLGSDQAPIVTGWISL